MGFKKLWIFSSLILILFLAIVQCSSETNENDEDDEFADTIIDDGHVVGMKEEPKEKYNAPKYQSPNIEPGKTHFLELFDDKKAIGKKWYKSESKKDGAEEAISKYDGEWSIGEPSEVILENDNSLIVQTKARHHAIAAKLGKTFKFDTKPFILQYEVKYEQGQECGGGYLKLLEPKVSDNLKQFNDKSPYVIMFGPDKCGMSSKIHFILRHKNPINGSVKEHHAKQSNKPLTNYFDDKKTHLYTLMINPVDNTFRVSIDKSEIMSGNLLNDLEPPLTPPKQIPDPEDKKPDDWDDRVMIDDPEAKKPDDWDESQPKEVLDEEATKPSDWLEEEESLIPDMSAKKPQDWDDEMDGEWEPRKVTNPKCQERSGCGKWTRPMKANLLFKGKWSPPRISNPDYKGPWTPKLVDNPHYFEGINLDSISVIGIELWTMSSGIAFDNIIVTDDESVANSLAQQTFDVKKAQETIYQSVSADSRGMLKNLLEVTEEKPWLWVVIIVGLLIPIIFISIFCFGRKTPKSDRKKTDEPVEDEEEIPDQVTQEEEIDQEEEEAEEVARNDEVSQPSASASSASSRTNSKPSTPVVEKKGGTPIKQQIDEPSPSTSNAPQESSPQQPTKRVRARRQD